MTETEQPEFLSNPKPVDIVLLVSMFGIAIYGFAMIPLRGWLLSHPLAYNLLVGGYTSAVVSGANVGAGQGSVAVYLAANLVGAVKFMPIYWLLGRRWGRDFIDLSVQYLPRIKRYLDKILTDANRRNKIIASMLVPLGYLPGPVPGNVINAVLGLFRIPFVAMLAINLLSILAVNGTMMYLGFLYDTQVLAVVETINRYLLWFTLGLIVILIYRMRKQFKTQ